MILTLANKKPVELALPDALTGKNNLVNIKATNSGIILDLHPADNVVSMELSPKEVDELLRLTRSKL